MDLYAAMLPSLQGLLGEDRSPALLHLASADPAHVSDAELDELIQRGFALLTMPETHSAPGNYPP